MKKIVKESLIESINEEFGQKDLIRMRDIKTKANGDYDKEIMLARTQANKITNPGKAKARAEAAEEVFGKRSDIAYIFHARARDLAGSNVRGEPSPGMINSWGSR